MNTSIKCGKKVGTKRSCTLLVGHGGDCFSDGISLPHPSDGGVACCATGSADDGNIVGCNLDLNHSGPHRGVWKQGLLWQFPLSDREKIAEATKSFQEKAAAKIADGGGLRKDDGKNPLHLVSPIALFEMGKVLQYGAKKYEDHNWRRGMKWSRCFGPLLRHAFKALMGEDYDICPEHNGKRPDHCDTCSGCLHMAHVMCNAMFLVEYFVLGIGTDDRHRTEIPDGR